MSDSDPVVSRREGDVLRLALNRPERSNALGPDIVEALLSAVDAAPAAGVRLIVLEGVGKHFCAGFDLGGLDALGDGDLLLRLVRIETLLQTVHHAPVSTMAVVRGAAMGAGADLVAACERRLVVGAARFAFPGAGFGIALGTRRLAERLGGDAARDLIASGRRIDQNAAQVLGLIDRIIGEDDLAGEIDRARATAGRLDGETQAAINRLTMEDGRARDMAALVASASRPGLKDRIAVYLDSVERERRSRKGDA